MSTKKEEAPLLSAGELGKLLGVGPRAIKLWVTKGRLTNPARTDGGHARFDPKQVAADLARDSGSVPPRLLAFVEAHSQEVASLRAVARASTEELRAELARREERGAA